MSQHIARFPKLDRYCLGLKLDNACLLLLEEIITAEQAAPVLKDRALLAASVKAEIIKVFLRLTKSTTPAPIGPKNISLSAKGTLAPQAITSIPELIILST